MATVATTSDADLFEGADEELITPGPLERNWRGIIIALIVIAAMCSLIIAAVFLITPFNVNSYGPRGSLSLSEIVENALLSPVESIVWTDDSRIVVMSYDCVKIINTTSLSANCEFDNRHGRILALHLSHDTNYAALAFDARTSAGGSFYRIYATQSQTFEPVGPTRSGSEPIQVFKWNTVSSDYAFVYMNDIYYNEGPESENVYRITTHNDSLIYNGICDWIYEEEIFGNNEALWWSKSGRYLAFASIDDRKVHLIQYPMFEHRQYPAVKKLPYPKTGVKNLPLVSVHIWDKETKETREMSIMLKSKSASTYLFAASWITVNGTDLLVAVFANRYQNFTSITLCTFDSAKCVLNYDQPYSIDGKRLWSDPENFPIKFFSNDSYLVSLPHRKASGEIFTQIAKISIPKGLINGRATYLSMGEYDVTAINAYNPETKLVYFTAASPLPSQRHLYVTQYDSVEEESIAECVTCNSAPKCTFQEIIFSNDADKYILSCRGPGVPRAYLSSISSNNSLIEELTNWKKLEKKYKEQNLARTRYENVTLSNGYVALVKMLLPPNHDPTVINRKYPVIVSVYAGPGSQKVTEETAPNSLDMFLASSKNIVVVYIDGRGSGMRGWKYKEPIYGNFGTVEIDDQIETMRILAAKHRFIDASRIGIWGWSYGGFVAAHVVERDKDHIFKCAVSVAPVTDFKLYDATYTERFMGAASELAYEKANLVRNVSMFKNVQFMLVHGTADDNVHLQNTAELIRALGEQNIQFQLMIYPDASHSLVWARMHLFTMITEFFQKCLQS